LELLALLLLQCDPLLPADTGTEVLPSAAQRPTAVEPSAVGHSVLPPAGPSGLLSGSRRPGEPIARGSTARPPPLPALRLLSRRLVTVDHRG
jgi:hypothetical protein